MLVNLPVPLPTLRHYSVWLPPRLTFRPCICWSSAYFCSSKNFKIPPELSMVIPDEKQVVRRLYKASMPSWAVLLHNSSASKGDGSENNAK